MTPLHEALREWIHSYGAIAFGLSMFVTAASFANVGRRNRSLKKEIRK